MQQWHRWAFILAIMSPLFFQFGCYSVYSNQPIGLKPLEAVPEQWEGTWGFPGEKGTVQIKVSDQAQGALTLLWLDEQGNVSNTNNILLMSAGDWTLGNIVHQDKDGSRYQCVRIQASDDQIICWLLDSKKIAALVQSNRLSGTVDTPNDDVFLTDINPTSVAAIASEQMGVLFKWDEPMVFVRVGPAVKTQPSD